MLNTLFSNLLLAQSNTTEYIDPVELEATQELLYTTISYLYVLIYYLVTYIILVFPIFLVLYVYKSVVYMKVAKRLDHKYPWFAWIPLLRSIQRLHLADLSGWLVVLLFIPVVNIPGFIVLRVIEMIRICEKRNLKTGLWVLGVFPITHLILLGILAWGKEKKEKQTKKIDKKE
jgi:uncharacterized membrane protein YesL